MKIATIGTRGIPNVQGGVEKHCEKLSVELVKLGCEVIVFNRKPYVDKSIKEYKGVRLITLPTCREKYLEAFIHTFFCVLTAGLLRPDIVHLHGIGPALYTPLCKLLGLKVVVTTHGSNYEHLKWGRIAKAILKLGEKCAARCADKLIGISTKICNEISIKYCTKAVNIPNGVDIVPRANTHKVLDEFGLKKGKYILAVGRLDPTKGFHDLIEAFIKLQQNHADDNDIRDWKLFIAGDADQPSDYSRKLKRNASRSSNIIMPGVIMGTGLRELYSHAGLFVLPSYYEGLPITVLEASSYGLPCALSKIKANLEFDLPGNRFFAPGDIANIEKTIVQLMQNPISEADKNAKIATIAGKYSWPLIAQSTMKVYIEVLFKK
jgi:glycosyltransferase involved in cell wall biosynthesis